MSTPVTFGKYELVARLARGGMAETYRAQLKGAAGVTKTVVIKKVLPHFAQDEQFIEAFINEAKISASLSHGNIAQVFDFGRVEGDYFLAMELVDGRSLNHVLGRAQEKGFAKLPVPIACFLGIEILKGLHYAHTRIGADGKPLSLVHRDVTPENVLISFEGDVKVVDFGVAKAAMQGRKETEPGLVKGKFLFFSPEQALAAPLDARSDVYAVGILLYRMLCGGLPFEGQMHTVMRAIVGGKFLPPAVVHPALPPPLSDAITKAMATKREERFGSALQLQEALASFLYRQEPTFSSETVKEWMTWLFKPELSSEGRSTSLSGRFEKQLTKWGTAGAVGPIPEVVTAPSAPAITQDAAPFPTGVKTKETPPVKDGASIAPWLAAGALVVVVGIGLGVVMGSEGDGPPEARPFVPPTMRAKVDARAAPVPVPAAAPAPAPAPEPVPAPAPAPPPANAPVDVGLLDANERIFFVHQSRLLPCLANVGLTVPVTVAIRVERGVVTGASIDQSTKYKSAVTKCLLTEARTWEFEIDRGPERTLLTVFDPAQPAQPLKMVVRQKPAPGRPPDPEPALGPPTHRGGVSAGNAFFEEGKRLMRDKQYPDAKIQLERCIKADPTHADCHKLLGTAWAKLGDPQKGAREYREFVRYAPPDHPDLDKVKMIINAYENSR